MGLIKYGCRFLVGLVSVLLFNVDGAFAQNCVVGGTDFKVSGISLFNPQLSNDEDGWFSEDVKDLIEMPTGYDYYATINHAVQSGLLGNEVHVPGAMITNRAWKADSATQSQAANNVGYSAITANPKLISPLLLDVGSELLVNFGTNHDQTYVLGYVLSGLAPGTRGEFTCTVYNLLDPESVQAYLDANAKTSGSISICGQNYDITNKKFNGQQLKLKYLVNGLDANGGTNIGGTTVPNGMNGGIGYGSSYKLTIPYTADQYGNASIYIGRDGGTNSIPIGIDDVKITAKGIKPTIDGKATECVGSAVTLGLKEAYPEGTTITWKEKNNGTVGNLSGLTFSPPQDVETTYEFTVDVTMPGCPTASATQKVSMEACCNDEDGNPLPLVDVYYEDFGQFQGNRYTYTDLNGNSKTVTATDKLGGKETHYAVGDLKTGGDAFPALTYSREIYGGNGDHFAISDQSAYSTRGDHTTNGNGGGYLMLDLQDEGNPYKNGLYSRRRYVVYVLERR